MFYLFKTLSFFRLIEYNKLSLVNIALMIVIYKLFKSPVSSLTDTVPLVIALGAHHLGNALNLKTIVPQLQDKNNVTS